MILDFSEFFENLKWLNQRGGPMAKVNLKLTFETERRDYIRRHLEKHYGGVIAA